jgi:hypothetical protein
MTLPLTLQRSSLDLVYETFLVKTKYKFRKLFKFTFKNI